MSAGAAARDDRALRRLLRFLRPYRARVALGTLCLVLSIPCSLFHPLVWKFVVDEVVLAKQYERLVPALAVMLVVHLTGTLLGFFRTLLLGEAGERFIFDLRSAVYDKLSAQGVGYFHERRAGDLVSRAINDVEVLRDAVVGGIDEMFSSLLSFLFVAGVIVYLHWVIGLVTLAPLACVAVLILAFNQRVKALYRRVRDRLGDVSAKLQETLSGVAVIKAFGRERFEAERFREIGRGYLDDGLRGVRVRAAYMPSILSVGFLSNVTMVGLGGWFVIQGSFTLGGLVAYRGYWWQLFSPVTSLARVNEVWQRANAAASRIVELLDDPPSVVDRPGALALAALDGDVEFEDVSFAYEPGRRALTDVSFRAARGQSIGVVGPSGSGKSTLLALILRFYDPERGRVRVDGRDLREIEQVSLRRHFALVAQDAFLFNDTVRENVRYGRLDATDAEIREAVRLANAQEFVEELPAGYATIVGERGVKLSGGQRQRVSIARAFLANPRVLLLDEATAAVEPESEVLIQGALVRLMQGRTTFIVSHRLSMVRDADVILVVRGGRVTEQGSHAELMAADGWYARMVRLQMGEEPPSAAAAAPPGRALAAPKEAC